MREQAKFNLLHKKWIAVLTLEGERDKVSLLDVFRRAHELHSLAGELPTQDIAVLRFLLAILHRVFGGKNIDGEPFPDDEEEQIDGALELWKALWSHKRFPQERIEAYLKEYEDRFELFHPKTPFYQVVSMVKATEYTAAKLNGEILESSNKPRLFPQRTANGKSNLTFAEAARWLLHVNGFDDTAAKPSQRGQGMPSPGAGWLGKLGLITAVGNNLFETLLLNLVLLPSLGNALWGDDKATWEEPPRTKERVQISPPNSQAALLTLQSRRLLLNREGDVVTGYFLQGGDFFPKENAFVEQMTVWRNNATKESAPPEYVPKRHNPSVQMWRDFAPLVGQGGGNCCPGVVGWLRKLKQEDKLEDSVFRFQISGVKYGDKDFFVEDVFFDSLSFNAGLLSELHKDWVARIIAELDVTASLVKEVGILAQNVVRAAGIKDGKNAGRDDGLTARDEAKAQAYYRLDEPFRRWLESIDPEADNTGEKIDKKCDEWWGTSQAIVRACGREIVENCSPQALTGRNGFSAPEAHNWFLYNTTNRETLTFKKKEGAKRGKSVKSTE
ncbi:MAG: type I-E CRISPR-associated protein Cse1/CasA [Cystobacterineae bacterium]|nr:type I-E CRISPR-associated protein Cse1/CasA [Cystobacterineae bacterium]